MSDWSLPPCVTLVFGRQGSGKTTFVFRYLANRATEQPANTDPAACIFIFDWKNEAEQRLGLPAVGTAAACDAAVASRWVIFNPYVSFDNLQQAFLWFLHWVYETSKRGPGKKIVFIDELWQIVSSNSQHLPTELEKVFRMGRAENLELVIATQYPSDYAKDLRASVTEWVCFNITEPEQLDKVRPYFPAVDKVASLPRGTFISYNRETGAELTGKLF